MRRFVVKQRLIFTLLWDRGGYMLSRNFRLQKVGDLQWLNKNYNFPKISTALDELVVLNASRGAGATSDFAAELRELTRNLFLPVAAGGGIRSDEDIDMLLRSGADKVVLNKVLHTDHDLVRRTVSRYGSQCVVASIDFEESREFDYRAVLDGAQVPLDEALTDTMLGIQSLGVGEFLLHSITRDGTGNGFVTELQDVIGDVPIPVILSGGAGHAGHFVEAFETTRFEGFATAHLFNFLGDSLPRLRASLTEAGMRIAQFD